MDEKENTFSLTVTSKSTEAFGGFLRPTTGINKSKGIQVSSRLCTLLNSNSCFKILIILSL